MTNIQIALAELDSGQLTLVAVVLVAAMAVVSTLVLAIAVLANGKLKKAQDEVIRLMGDPGATLTPIASNGEKKGPLTSADQAKLVARLAETLIDLTPSPASLFVAIVPMILAAAVVLTAIIAGQ